MKEDIARLAGRLGKASTHGGLRGALSEAAGVVRYRLHSRLLDPLLAPVPESEDTIRTTQLADLTITSPNRSEGVEYAPTPHLTARLALSLLPDDVRDWTFVDVGAGRGRMVVTAARRPFREVWGIEFACELAEDARRNVAAGADTRRAGEVRILNEDATLAPLPDGPTAFYLYNPFGSTVLRRFLERIVNEYDARPNPVVILYLNPQHEDLFGEFPAFRARKLPMLLRAKLWFASNDPIRVFDLRPELLRNPGDHHQVVESS